MTVCGSNFRRHIHRFLSARAKSRAPFISVVLSGFIKELMERAAYSSSFFIRCLIFEQFELFCVLMSCFSGIWPIEKRA